MKINIAARAVFHRHNNPTNFCQVSGEVTTGIGKILIEWNWPAICCDFAIL